MKGVIYKKLLAIDVATSLKNATRRINIVQHITAKIQALTLAVKLLSNATT